MSDQHQGNDKIEDSLDNLSNLKLRQSSLQKHRVELIQVKQRFISFLQKLQVSQTRQISLSQLKKLIQKNNESDHLRMYLSILKTLKPNHNSTTKQHQVLVISIITKVFKSNLIDSFDKQPSLLKTCFKVIQILMGFFNDTSNTVQQACARVLLDLNQFCLQQGKYQKQQKLSLLFAPLVSILRNGVDKASQATATVCINQLVKFWYSSQAKQYLDLVAKEIFSIILKINSEYHEIFMTAIILIDHKGLSFFENKLPNFISKILPIIDGTRQAANNFNSYMCKVNVCKILQKIALLLSFQQRQKLADLNIIGSLTKAARNKIIQVQTAATRSIKIWKGQSVSVQKNDRSSNSLGKPLRSLEQIRDQKKRQRSNSKQNTIKIQNQLQYMKEDLEKMVKGGWGANNRAKHYVKRGTGVGGGHYGQVGSTPPKNNKSHRQHLEQLRSIIQKGSKQNKNIDKFIPFVDPSKGYKQIPTNSNNNVNAFVQRNQREVPKSAKNIQQPINSNPKRNNFINQENDFQIADDDGDQCVNIQARQKPNLQKKKSDNKDTPIQKLERKNSQTSTQKAAQHYQISAEQANQLLQNQRNLTQRETLDLNLNQNKEKKLQTDQKGPLRIKDQKFIQRASKIKQNLASMGPMISEEQLQQLMMQNNLSDISDNIQGCLNQSDFQMDENKVLVMSGFEDSIRSNVEQPVNFTKKKNQKLGESLNYTQSGVSNFKQSIAKKDNKIFSQNSPQKVGQPLRQQFTLNPNRDNINANKFQSIHNPKNVQADQQIQEDIVQSYYEQSHPKEQNMLPLKTKLNPSPSPKQPSKQIQNKKLSIEQQQSHQQQISKNYLQLIQNPPVSYQQQKHLDKKSFIKQNQKNQQQINEHDQQQIEQQQQTVTDKWIRILSLIQNNDINTAFEQAFQLDDPIYLIRLLIITRTPIANLTAQNCTQLWTKFIDIYKHNFISILFVQLFTQASDLNLIKNSLTIQQMHQLLVKLYQVSGTSKGKLSFNAALLYNKVDQTLRPNKN